MLRKQAMLAIFWWSTAVCATDWIEVGADTEAKYYVDVDSILVNGENIRFMKRGVYTHVLTDNLDGHPTAFKETRGIVEVDCGRRINRVTQIELVGEDSEVVWSSGPLKKRMWEDVRINTHAEYTLNFVCGRVKRI